MDVEPVGASTPPEPVEATPQAVVSAPASTPPPGSSRPPQEQAAPLPPETGQNVDLFA
jgi:hypothetical protein